MKSGHRSRIFIHDYPSWKYLALCSYLRSKLICMTAQQSAALKRVREKKLRVIIWTPHQILKQYCHPVKRIIREKEFQDFLNEINCLVAEIYHTEPQAQTFSAIRVDYYCDAKRYALKAQTKSQRKTGWTMSSYESIYEPQLSMRRERKCGE